MPSMPRTPRPPPSCGPARASWGYRSAIEHAWRWPGDCARPPTLRTAPGPRSRFLAWSSGPFGSSLPLASLSARLGLAARPAFFARFFIVVRHAGLADQVEQILAVQARGDIGAVEDAGGELALLLVQGQHRFLNRGARDHADHGDRAILADAVGAVGGLILDGWVPPGIQVNDVGGGGQVQSGAARAQRK